MSEKKRLIEILKDEICDLEIRIDLTNKQYLEGDIEVSSRAYPELMKLEGKRDGLIDAILIIKNVLKVSE